jgi:hypothetical protein
MYQPNMNIKKHMQYHFVLEAEEQNLMETKIEKNYWNKICELRILFFYLSINTYVTMSKYTYIRTKQFTIVIQYSKLIKTHYYKTVMVIIITWYIQCNYTSIFIVNSNQSSIPRSLSLINVIFKIERFRLRQTNVIINI